MSWPNPGLSAVAVLAFGLALTCEAHTAGAAPRKPTVHTALGDVVACLPLPGGEVLAATAGGLALVDRGDGLRARQVWTAMDGLPGTRVHTLLAAASGPDGAMEQVDVGTEGGLARLSRRGSSWHIVGTVPSQPVRAMVRHHGDLWLATWGGGLRRLRGEQLRARSVKLAPQLPVAIRRDARNLTALTVHQGQLIAASAGGGLWQLRAGVLTPMAVTGLPRQLIWRLHTHRSQLLVATLDGLHGVAAGRARRLLDGDVRDVAIVAGAPIAAIRGSGLRALDGARSGPQPALRLVQGVAVRGPDLCAATAQGLWLNRARTWQRAALGGLPEGDVAALAWHAGGLWAGTYHKGLQRLQGGQWQAVAKRQIDRRINGLVVEPGREGGPATLWVATARGLFALRGQSAPGDGVRDDTAAGATVRRWGKADGLPAEDVHALILLRGGGVAVGTASGAALLRGGHPEPLGAKQGLPVRAVWALAEDPDGALWLGSSWGLYRYEDGHVQRFSVATGHLSDDWITALAVTAGRIWVGTYRHGVDRLDRQVDASWRATALGGGWINLGGLRLQQGQLLAATMDGLKIRPLVAPGAAPREASWTTKANAAPGRDVTATLSGGGRLWVASRRGIASF